MKIIQGVKIDESKDLGFNLKLLRENLRYRLSFWSHYQSGVKRISKSMETQRVNVIVKLIYFILLIPKYITYKFSKRQIARRISNAEDELIEHYKLPETKVKQFRLECEEEGLFYLNEIQIIKSEIHLLQENLNSQPVGGSTKVEIVKLIKEYEENLSKKLLKYQFYKSCEDRLVKIEEQIMLQKTLQDSKKKLLALQEDESDSSRLTEIKKEFELYDYYGDLLEDIYINLKKVSGDKEEKLRELELNEMLSKIKIEENPN